MSPHKLDPVKAILDREKFLWTKHKFRSIFRGEISDQEQMLWSGFKF